MDKNSKNENPEIDTELAPETEGRLRSTFNELVESLDQSTANPSLIDSALQLNNKGLTLQEIENELKAQFPFDDIDQAINFLKNIPSGSELSGATILTLGHALYSAMFEVYGVIEKGEDIYYSVTFSPLQKPDGSVILFPDANLDIYIDKEKVEQLKTRYTELLTLVVDSLTKLDLKETYYYLDFESKNIFIDDFLTDADLRFEISEFGDKIKLGWRISSNSMIQLIDESTYKSILSFSKRFKLLLDQVNTTTREFLKNLN